MKNKYKTLLQEINLYENEFKLISNESLIDKSYKIKKAIEQNKNKSLIKAFALIKEVSWRTLGLKHFDTQLFGGLILNEGKIIEMKTGEGKTLVSTLPSYYNALNKKGVHLITVNEYLAERDQKSMGEIYRFLNLTVGLVQEQMTEKEKQINYNADITYLTNTELGFDYLRDNLSLSPQQIVQRSFNYGIIDEVDSVLIDEARTPLIISGQSDSYIIDKYIQSAELVKFLLPDKDFIVFEKEKLIKLTENGIQKIQKILNIGNLYGISKMWVPYILNAIRAKIFFFKDVNYIQQENKILIVDEFTGRLMPNRKWNDGMHQSIEAKENIPISEMSQTLASITYQNLFLLYPKLSGMTGTAKTAETELYEIYNLKVEVVPPNKISQRKDLSDFVYIDELSKWKGVIKQCLTMQKMGRPILVGTVSVAKSELVSELLTDYGIVHNILNARPENVKKESEIISQAGRLSSVTISTNIAGRGADIPLGGDPKTLAAINLDKILNLQMGNIKIVVYNSNISYKFDTKNSLVKFFYQNPRSIIPVINQRYLFKRFKYVKKVNSERYLFELLQASTNAIINRKFDERNRFNLPIEWMYLQLFNRYKKITYLENKLVTNLGGLYVIGTERHESARVDNQLRGRTGRQGAPGTTRFFISLDDNLLRIFGGDVIQKRFINQKLVTLQLDQPLESNILQNTIDSIQEQVEDFYYDSRKSLFKYDEILDKQRLAIFRERQISLFTSNPRNLILMYSESVIEDFASQIMEKKSNQKMVLMIGIYLSIQFQLPYDELNSIINTRRLTYLKTSNFLRKQLWKSYDALESYAEIYFPKKIRFIEKTIILRNIDKNWKYHLQRMVLLQEAINLRSYAQVDPFIEYKNDALNLFLKTLQNIKYGIYNEIFGFLFDL
jgi:preprotein translocase subunit SecA